jgi:hypothetical protein
MPSLQFSADSSLLSVIVIMTMFFVEHFYGQAYTWQEARPVLLGQVFMVMATLCINGSTAYGKAGAVQALMQVQAPF